MPYQPVKYYQSGSFAVGNRLLEPDERTVQSDRERSNTLTSGHRACQGCGEALGARYALDAAMRASGGRLIAANATGCLEVFSTPYPESSWQLPWIHSLFGNAPAVATGIAAALRVKGRDDVRVIGQGGDGGTVDIGFACLSGMFERNDDVLFICYDNEGYMNTGVQRSARRRPRRARRPRRPSATSPATSSARARAPADRDGARDPLRGDRDGRRPARPRGQGRARDGDARRALHPHPRHLPAGLGQRRAATRSGSRGSPTRPGCSPSSRRTRGDVTGVSKIRRQVPVEEYLRPQRRFAPPVRARAPRGRHRAHPGPRRPQHRALRAAADGPRSPSRSRSTSAPAWPTRPARGAPSARSTSHRLPPCDNACPAGEDPQEWLYHAEEGDYEAAWREIMRRQPVPGHDGARLLPPVRDRLQPRRSSTRPSASTPSSASSATRRSAAAGRVEVDRAAVRQARARRRRRALGPVGRLPPRARSATR